VSWPAEGAYVGAVRSGSPGELAGVQVGDVVVELNGHSIRTSGDLEREVAALAAGSKAPLIVVRAGRPLNLQLGL